MSIFLSFCDYLCHFVEFVGFTVDSPQNEEENMPSRPPPAEPIIDTSQVHLDDLMARVRHHVLINRLRVIEYFEDYDPLRSGSISKSQFRRGLSQLGLSKLGHHDLTDPQYTVLCILYENPNKRDQVLWTKFLWDIESGKQHLCFSGE